MIPELAESIHQCAAKALVTADIAAGEAKLLEQANKAANGGHGIFLAPIVFDPGDVAITDGEGVIVAAAGKVAETTRTLPTVD